MTTMTRTEARNLIESIAEDIARQRGCPPHDVSRWATCYTHWQSACGDLTAVEIEAAIRRGHLRAEEV